MIRSEQEVNMVAPNTEQMVKDAVCPVCFKPLVNPMVNEYPNGAKCKRPLRTYFAWCFNCNKGFEVIQFERERRWVIHKYQEYTVDDKEGKCRHIDDWTVLNEMPEAPLVMTGPGGDYVKEICGDDINKMLDKTLEGIGQVLTKLGNILTSVVQDRRDAANS